MRSASFFPAEGSRALRGLVFLKKQFVLISIFQFRSLRRAGESLERL